MRVIAQVSTTSCSETHLAHSNGMSWPLPALMSFYSVGQRYTLQQYAAVGCVHRVQICNSWHAMTQPRAQNTSGTLLSVICSACYTLLHGQGRDLLQLSICSALACSCAACCKRLRVFLSSARCRCLLRPLSEIDVPEHDRHTAHSSACNIVLCLVCKAAHWVCVSARMNVPNTQSRGTSLLKARPDDRCVASAHAQTRCARAGSSKRLCAPRCM